MAKSLTLDEIQRQVDAMGKTSPFQPVPAMQPDTADRMVKSANSYAQLESGDDSESDHSLWSMIQWLNVPFNTVSNVAFNVLSGESDLIGAAVRGATLEQNVSGKDLIHAAMRETNSGARAAWRLKAAQMGLSPEKFGDALVTDPALAEKIASPMGVAGSIGGFALEVAMDPLNLLGAVGGKALSKFNKMGDLVGDAEKARALQHINAYKSIISKMDEATGMPKSISAIRLAPTEKAAYQKYMTDVIAPTADEMLNVRPKWEAWVKARESRETRGTVLESLRGARSDLRMAKKGEDATQIASADARVNELTQKYKLVKGIDKQLAKDLPSLTPREQAIGSLQRLLDMDTSLIDNIANYSGEQWSSIKLLGTKIADENGVPMRVYHGRSKDFSAFSKDAPASTMLSDGKGGAFGDGFYFTSSPETASAYAFNAQDANGGNANVMPAFVDIKNPYVIREFTDADKNGLSAMARFVGKNLGDKSLAGEITRLAGRDDIPPIAKAQIIKKIRESHGPQWATEAMQYAGYDGVIWHTPDGKGLGEVVAFRPDQVHSAFERRFWESRSPIEDAAAAADFPQAGISALTSDIASMNREFIRRLGDAQAAFGRQIIDLGHTDIDTMLATVAADRVFNKYGMAAGKGVQKGAPIANPNLMGEVREFVGDTKKALSATKRTYVEEADMDMIDNVREHLKATGTPDDAIERAVPEHVDAIHKAQNLVGMLNDYQFIDKAEVKLTPELLTQATRDQVVISATIQNALRQIRERLWINKNGIEVTRRPLDPSLIPRDAKGKIAKMTVEQKAALKEARAAAVVRIGKDALDPETAKELAAAASDLEASYKKWLVSADQQMADPMEAVFGSVKIPALGIWGLRSPKRIYRNTGVYELFRSASLQHKEAHDFYQTARVAIGKGVDEKVLQGIGAHLDGVMDDAALVAAHGQDALDLSRKYRVIFDEIADLAGLPKDKRISNYLPHVYEMDAKQAAAVSAGHLAPELMRDEVVFGAIAHRSDIGKKWMSRFMKGREGKLAEYQLNVDDVLRVYINSVMKAKYLSPAFEEAGTVIRGLKTFDRIGNVRFLPGAADKIKDAFGNPIGDKAIEAAREQMLAYTDDLQRMVLGQPTRSAERISSFLSNSLASVGVNRSKEEIFTRATQVSSAILQNLYLGTMGGMVATPVINLTQNILTASERGPLNWLKGVAAYVGKNDPYEILQAGGRMGHKGVETLHDAEIAKVLQKYGIAEEAFGMAPSRGLLSAADEKLGIAKNAWNLDRVRRGYVGAMMKGMELSEAANRGIAYHVGLTMAHNQGLGFYDALRFAHQVADETQFVYGWLGRGPAFGNPFTKPVISPFTSYPANMLGWAGRMWDQNKGALWQYVFYSGGLAAQISRLGLDPAQVVPFSFLQNRFAVGSSIMDITPFARAFRSLVFDLPDALAKGDEAQADRAKVNLVESMGFLMGAPVALTKHAWQQAHIYKSGDIYAKRDMYKLLGLFESDGPMIVGRVDENASRGWAILAKTLGFSTESEKISREIIERQREMRKDRAKNLKTVESIMRRNIGEDMDDADLEEIQKAAAAYGGDSVENILKKVNETWKSLPLRQSESLPLAERRRMWSGIAGLPSGSREDAMALMRARDDLDLETMGMNADDSEAAQE